MTNFTREDLAWVAGLLEGEGCFFMGRYKHKDRTFPHLAITLQMIDEDTVKRVYSILGLGKVHGPYKTKAGKDLWRWGAHKRDQAYAIMTMIYPWMCSRRRTKIKACLEFYKTIPPVKSHAEIVQLANIARKAYYAK